MAIPDTASRGASPLDRHRGRYEAAFLDWTACAIGGRDTAPARAAAAAADGPHGELVALAAAGHALDYDDTYGPGLSHVSAAIAPVALWVGARTGATIEAGLRAYARAFEVAASLSAANHPALYDRGWHPTAVCGAVGAAVVASALLDADEAQAIRLALLQAAGLRAAFGSDGKALQVGFAAAAGVQAARLAAAGAHVADVGAGVTGAYGLSLAHDPDGEAIRENWIKAYPCCLQTHAPIEAATAARARGTGLDGAVVRVHPRSLQAAALRDAEDGLQAKFSIPYLTAYAWLHGTPVLASFADVEADARALGARIAVETDPALLQSEAELVVGGERVAHVRAALGSPEVPMTADQLGGKLRELAGDRLDGALADPALPMAHLLTATGLRVGGA
jgi:2-methylcitrate dehydratase PrpD